MKTIKELKQDGILKDHNIPTYQQVQELFESGEKHVGIVQATGTGKSYLAMQWLFDNVFSQPNQHALVLDPLYGIVKQFKELSDRLAREKGISPYDMPILFSHYDQLKTLSDKDIKLLDFDYIVLDEFHNLGAEGRGSVTQKLLKANPEAKVLGVTATPIRYLDKNRDMGDELFGDNIVQGITLTEAIENGILPKPNYVMTTYSYADTIATIEGHIKTVKDKQKRELFEKELEKAKRKAEGAENISQTFARKIQRKNGKFIAFCSDTERLNSLKTEIQNGLFGLVNPKVKIYQVTYKDGRDNATKIIKQFEEDKSDCLKIMLAVDMFNEGIHVKDVEGCFLFRPTISPRIYLQQIGRVLSVRADKDFQPLIFDVVNNIQCLDQIKEIFAEDRAKGNGGIFGGEDDLDVLPFDIDGNNLELDELLRVLDNAISVETTDSVQYLAAAERYKNKFGNLNVPQRYVEEKTELKLGGWLNATIFRYRALPSIVNKKVVNRLLELDPRVFEYTMENSKFERDYKILEGVKAWPKNKQIPKDAKSPLDKEFFLGSHISNIKFQLSEALKSKSYSKELINQINEINPFVLMSAKEYRDFKIIEGVKAWSNGQQIPADAVSPVDEDFSLGSHISRIRSKSLNGKDDSYSQELINQINEINPFVLKTTEEYRDFKIIEGVKVWPKNKQIPGKAMSPIDKLFPLGVHISEIKYRIKQNKLRRQCKEHDLREIYSQQLTDQINEINPFVLMSENEYRDFKIIEGVEAWPKNKQIPQRAVSPKDEEFHLGGHIFNIKGQLNANSKYNNSFSQNLIDQINEINPFVLMSAEEYRDFKIIEGVKAWPKNQRIPVEAISPIDNSIMLGKYISKIRSQLTRSQLKNNIGENNVENVYSQKLIDQINEINPFVLMSTEDYKKTIASSNKNNLSHEFGTN